jgi:hypothetical protein
MNISKTNIQRLKALAIFLLPIFILVVSTFFFYAGKSPEGRTNNGLLIDPSIDLISLDIEIERGPLLGEFPGKWTVLHFIKSNCNQSCWDSLYKSRQVNIRLSKDGNRMARYLIKIDKASLNKDDILRMRDEYPRLFLGHMSSKDFPVSLKPSFEKGFYILFDPLGNGFMIYDSSLPGGELLEDLKKLLRNSKIG